MDLSRHQREKELPAAPAQRGHAHRLDELRRRRYADDLPALDVSDAFMGRDGPLLLRSVAALGVSTAAGALATADVIASWHATAISVIAALAWSAAHLLSGRRQRKHERRADG